MWGVVPLAKGDIPFVVAIIGRWKYGCGGGSGSGARPSIFQNTRGEFQNMQIKVFTTGGSLDKGYSTRDSDFIVQGPQIGNILGEANVDFDSDIEALLRKDSLDLTEEDRDLIAERVAEDPCGRILITHGTDTMAETGRRLASVAGKTIVLTGAMQPASFKRTDAPFNVGFALAALQLLPPGVYLAMNGNLFNPDQARKNMELDRFEKASPGA